MIATNCQGCGTELTAGDSACRQCGGLTGRPSEPSPAGQHSSGQAGTPMGEAAGPVPRRPYLLMDLSTWLTATLATFAIVTLAGLAVPGSNAASVAVDVVAVLLILTTGPVFLVWLYHASSNAEQSGYRQRRSAGWAIGAWFVPVIALWLPYQVVSDIWRAAQAPERRARIPWLVVTWWTCWLLAWATGYRYTGTARPFPIDWYPTTVDRLLFTAAAILLILIIRTVSDGLGSDHREPSTAYGDPRSASPSL